MGSPRTYFPKPGAHGRPRCRHCLRVLTNREYLAGLAECVIEQGDREVAQHSYPCEDASGNLPRRKP